MQTNIYYSRKLTEPQTRYMEMEKQLLRIIENLKEFFTVSLCQRLKIYAEHKYLTSNFF